MGPDWVDVLPIENGDIPASYVSLPEGIICSKSIAKFQLQMHCYVSLPECIMIYHVFD